MASGLARGGIAVVGVAEADLGAAPAHTSPSDLIAQAVRRALDDAGMKLDEVDGLFVSSNQVRYPVQNAAEYLGIRPRWFDSTNLGGASALDQLAKAQAAIQCGLCEVALIAFGSTQRLVSRKVSSPVEAFHYETAYRPLLPVGGYALATTRHMHEYGTTREHLAQVAVSARQWALLNPVAWEKEPLSIEEVLAARPVSSPLGIRDCCLVNDGGGALIVTSAARARSTKKAPGYVLGIATQTDHRSISMMEDLTRSAATETGRRAFAMAGLSVTDVDVAELYDCFTITPIMFLEDLGFCKKGEGGPFIEGGRTAPGGDFPMNTNGGGLSYCHPGHYGILLIIEAVRQLRGESGRRQVPDCEVVLVHGNGGQFSTECTIVMGNAATV